MNKQNEQQDKRQDYARKPYEAPRLMIYGDITQLTSNMTMKSKRDNPGSTKS